MNSSLVAEGPAQAYIQSSFISVQFKEKISISLREISRRKQVKDELHREKKSETKCEDRRRFLKTGGSIIFEGRAGYV